MKNEKKKITVVVSIIALIILVGGATFAFFQAQADSGKSVDINVNAKTVDLLTFETGDVLEFDLNRENFGEGAGNMTANTFAQANLIANNVTNEATASYYLYLLISTNEFKYTIVDKRPEILLQVTDPSGNEITSIDGVKYVTATQADGTTINGFDITTYKGLLQITSAYEIKSSSSEEYTTQKWNFQVVFVNYDEDQTANTDKSLHAKVIIQSNEMENPTVADLCNAGESLTDCIMGLDGYITTLYHHNGTILDTSGNVLDAADDSYRFSGASADVNNYVCLSDAKMCPDDDLYRIIGVFNETAHGLKDTYLVKLIKLTSYGSYAWNSTLSIDWSTASLKETLNTTFITEKLSAYEDKIAEVYWKHSGNGNYNTTAKVYFNQEVVNASLRSLSKMGLMYISDYGFATSTSNWTATLYNYSGTDVKNNNWMFLGLQEWTITPVSPTKTTILPIRNYGDVYSGLATTGKTYTRPVFYFNSKAKYASGIGSKTNPFRLS